MQNIFVWGFNFRTAPISVREILACSKEENKKPLACDQIILWCKGIGNA
jgi:glutamyl-tRNA reductase (EC 1.2.1.70)